MVTVTAAHTTSITPNTWEESTGLLSSLIPQASGSTSTLTSPQAFNTTNGELKLGPAPLPDELRIETERLLREQSIVDRDPPSQHDTYYQRPTTASGVVAPTEADLLPRPPTFKTVDAYREMEKVRDARKRIRLDPSALHNVDVNSTQAGTARIRALPSICAFTLQDVPEGYVFTLNRCTA
jgi:transcription initiation factor TFIID subunit 5